MRSFGRAVAWIVTVGLVAGCGDDTGATRGAGGGATTGTSVTGTGGDQGATSAASGGGGRDGSGGAGLGGEGVGAAGGAGQGGAGGGSGGSGGGAEATDLMGWAAVPGMGVETTIGGHGGEVVTVTTADALREQAGRPEPLIIQIEGVIEAPRVDVASNKTLVGVGDAATLRGGLAISGAPEAFVSNVIVSNLNVDAATSEAGGDGIGVRYAHHVWVDHCAIWNAPDGNLDITRASDLVTVSWTRFGYDADAPDPGHRFSNLIGAGDDAGDEDRDALNVTLHHNLWGAGVRDRMPRVRFGDVHVLNNYVHAPDNGYVVMSTIEARVLVEANHFHEVDDPHLVDDDSAELLAIDNLYEDTTGEQDEAGSAFEPPYDYTPAPADQVRAIVEAGVGPRP